jgi:thiosulfate/3-mercaptopyruvate sulfurtransferase
VSRRESVLVDGDWLQSRLGDDGLVVLEVDERPLVYRLGHVPGAHSLDWHTDLQDPVTRDIPDRDAIGRLFRRVGLGPDSTVVLYGDESNWYACFAFWLLRLYGLRNLRLLDGGRQAWLVEGRPVTTDGPPENVETAVVPPRRNTHLRAGWRDIAEPSNGPVQLLDVRTPAEYRGDVLTEPGYAAEGAQRPGHIPGAHNVPWDIAVDNFVSGSRALVSTQSVLRSPTAGSVSGAPTRGSCCTSCSGSAPATTTAPGRNGAA